MESIRVQYNFGGIIEEYTSSLVTEVVAQTVLRGVIDPFLNPDFIVFHVLEARVLLGRLECSIATTIWLLRGSLALGTSVIAAHRVIDAIVLRHELTNIG